MTDLGTTRTHAGDAVAPVSAGSAQPVSVALVTSQHEADEVVDLLAQVWARPDGKAPLPGELAWVFAHSGNYVAIARVGTTPVGAAIGFFGSDAEGSFLHSHIVGVLPSWQGASVGYLVKQHQRTWCLERGLDRVTWTFDPLVARNAYFNVVKLGARLTRYYVDFYGPMDDGINAGDETDRCLVTWRLRSPSAEAASAGAGVPADTAACLAAGAVESLGVDDGGRPVPGAASGDTRLVRLPVDIVALRRGDPGSARAWRLALRSVLSQAFADGFEVVGVSRDGTYVLARP